MQKQQIIIIHGGETFATHEDYLEYLRNYDIERSLWKLDTKRWKDNLQKDLGDGFEILKPAMPSQRNAKYLEWKIWFDKFLPHMKESLILIGYSLGGIFLAKYLVENNLPVGVSQLHLVAAVFDEKSAGENYSLTDFNFESGDFSNVEKQAKKIFLYHSKDDFVTDFRNLEKYAEKLPKAERVIFEDRGHFLDEHFPELVKRVESNKLKNISSH